MLLTGAIANHGSILDGPPNRRLLRHNADAFKVNLSLELLLDVMQSIGRGEPEQA